MNLTFVASTAREKNKNWSQKKCWTFNFPNYHLDVGYK